ncbi:MAG: PP-loop family-domain-containing protein [Olpidium bornovanus]|uniref:tRNA(Ile)-lysidine synthetase n=1 Tax=Olpidium bornovanus TaxID=278681 RepID=A0A8H8DF29_9FUNG|nr:MAG: PP-loop family-domain-containing protein [Olpidium bornovanus]
MASVLRVQTRRRRLRAFSSASVLFSRDCGYGETERCAWSTARESGVGQFLLKWDACSGSVGIRDHRIMKVAWDTRDDSCGDAEREMRDGPSEALRIRPAQIEILGRRKRYALLAQACKASNIKYLVTAHHADDQAETVLYRFARGSLAIQGLAGMHPMAGVPVRVPGSVGLRVVRPLLEYNKSRLIETCRAANIPWFEDTTNADLRHARNNIRSFFSEIKQRKLDLTGEGDHDDRSLAPLSSASWVALANRMADHQRKLKERGWSRFALVGPLWNSIIGFADRSTAALFSVGRSAERYPVLNDERFLLIHRAGAHIVRQRVALVLRSRARETGPGGHRQVGFAGGEHRLNR